MKKSGVLKWFFAIIPVLGFYLIANNTWYSRDDWRYRFFFNGQDFNREVPFDNFFLEIWQSLINHWHLWNGRAVAHFFVQGMMQLPYWAVTMIFTFVFTLVALIILKVSDSRVTPMSFLLITVAMLLAWPEFGDSFLWVSGVGNYSLMIVFELLSILLGTKFIQSRKLIWGMGLLVIAPIVGNTSEIGGPAAFAFLTIYLLLSKTGWATKLIIFGSDFLGFLGFAVIYLSPGATLRKENGDLDLLVRLLPNLPKTIEVPQQYHIQGGQLILSWVKWIIENSWPVWTIIILAVAIMALNKQQVLQMVLQDKILISATVAYAFSCAVMLVAGTVSNRAANFFFLYLIIMGIRIVSYVRISSSYRGVILGSVLVTAILFLSCGYQVTNISKQVREMNNEVVHNGQKLSTLPQPDYSKLNSTIKKIGLRYNTDLDSYCDDITKMWIIGWMNNYYNDKKATAD